MWDSGISADGSGTIKPGRRCDLSWRYPEDYLIFAGTHAGGQLWSSALMNIWGELGADLTDELLMTSHFYWGQSPGMQDAAQAFIQADEDLYNGLHLPVITYWFDFHGLVNIVEYQPKINHIPLTDTEDLQGPYTILCDIVPASTGLDTSNIWLIWGKNSHFSDSLKMTVSGDSFTFRGHIPGVIIPTSVNYYIYAADSLGLSSTEPDNAPEAHHSFYAGPDTVSPVISHDPLDNILLSAWPPSLRVQVSDNIGIDTVWFEYMINDSLTIYTRGMLKTASADIYEGMFYADSGSVISGDTIHYRILVRDVSGNQNIAVLPANEYYSFVVFERPFPPQNVAVTNNEAYVELQWSASGYEENTQFKIYKGETIDSFLHLDSTTHNSYTDTLVILGRRYYYYVTASSNLFESDPSDTVDTVVETVISIDSQKNIPGEFKLMQNFPNPFNPSTTILYDLPQRVHVQISVYNLLGQKINTLVDSWQAPGHHEVVWTGQAQNGEKVSSGVYLYHIKAGYFISTRKMIILQ
jgi:hypothetical protein